MAKSLIIDNILIKEPVDRILKQVRRELSNGKLKTIIQGEGSVRVTCPHHKGGKETHASCGVYIGDNPDIEYGTCHCFTCGFKGSLIKFIAECFDSDLEFAKEWLLNRYGNTYVEDTLYLPKIELNNNNTSMEERCRVNEEKINSYTKFHPYMTKRKLSQEICEKFKVCYDKDMECIVFPTWDENDNLVMLTRRSVKNKTFIIDKGVEKPVYLLNYILKEGISSVYVVESQINCLTLWSLGYPAIALLGTGTSHQFEVLNKSGIWHYTLCFDGDYAGKKGEERFKQNINKNALIDVVNVPQGKDINDLDKEQIKELIENRNKSCII